MSNFFDANTNILMGNSEIIPLEKPFSTNDEIKNAVQNTILSASGWRRIFAESGNEEDNTTEIGKTNTILSVFMADCFVDFIKEKSKKKQPIIAVAIDARPTGSQIAQAMIRIFLARGLKVNYLFIASAPEIMAYARDFDGFVYISASHNPIGHNGVKFGLNDGGVIPGTDAIPLAEEFKKRVLAPNAGEKALELLSSCKNELLQSVFEQSQKHKADALESYTNFTKLVVSNETEKAKQNDFFELIQKNCKQNPIGIVCDMNGSARTVSIDKEFFAALNIPFYAINNKPQQIVHGIIPEPENLIYCAEEILKLQKTNPEAILGYMPDCDGDRGNIVFMNKKSGECEVLKAQEVFALSAMAETAHLYQQGLLKNGAKAAIVVNDPTSMRIEEIAQAFGVEVFRAEVGEANVVNLAREKRDEGYIVRILGEGSNGGNITHPAAVRDPINTIFAILKLLTLKDTQNQKGLFHIWCDLSNQSDKYLNDFSLDDVLKTLPIYTTTGVSEKRAITKITQSNHSILKANYQKVFELQWKQKKEFLQENFGIFDYEAICNNGTKEKRNISDYSISNKGGLKILFKGKNKENVAFLWMRGSGTEPVFRIMCDLKGKKPKQEQELLAWHEEMLQIADKM